MSCSCKKKNCCCDQMIGPMGPRGNPGPIGPVGPQGINGNALPITVVSTSGGSFSPPAYTVLGTEDVILVNTTGGPVIIYLLAANSASVKKIVNIKDAFGTAATYNIVIVPAGSDTIDGAASKTMSVAYQNLAFVSNGTTGYNIL